MATIGGELELVRRALFGNELLGGLAARLDDVLADLETLRLPAGEILFREGDEAHDLYVVLEGAVQAVGTGLDGRELVLRRVEPGELFGEQAILPGPAGRRTATVRAAEPTVLLRVGRDVVRRLVGGEEQTRLRALGDRHARAQLARRSRLVGSLGFDPHARERSVAAGGVLFSEGDEADCVYLVLAGSAAVYRAEGGRRVLIGRVQAGRCVGELAFVRRARRAATVVAETDLRVMEVDGRRFIELLESSPELSAQMRALEHVYQLPARGVVTQHTGVVLGAEAITTLYHLDDGRQFAASRIIASGLYDLERVAPSAVAGEATVLRYGSVELSVLTDGTIVGISAAGDWPDLAGAHLLAIDGIPLTREQRTMFEHTGVLTAALAAVTPVDPRAILCTCVHVTRDAVDTAIREGCRTPRALQDALACGTVCGACLPRLTARLGEAAWTPVDVIGEIELTPRVRAFRLRPARDGMQPWLPGQHIVVSAWIDGRWIERSYTLSGPPDADHYEITVKREPLGLFSRWLFDDRDADEQLRVSEPHGEAIWAEGDEPMLCFVGGIGVTPAVAALRAGAALHVHYSGRRRSNLAYLEELRRARSLVVRETATEGRLAAADVHELVALHSEAHAFVCGPSGYLLDVAAHLRGADVPAERIHVTIFTQAGAPIPERDTLPARPKWMPRSRR